MPNTRPWITFRYLIGIACFVVIIAGLRSAKALVVPFLLSTFVAFISAPAVAWLERRGTPRGLAVTAIFVAIVASFVFIMSIMGRPLDTFTTTLAAYSDKWMDPENLKEVDEWFRGRGLSIQAEELFQSFNPASVVTQYAGNLMRDLGKVFSNVFLISLSVVFMLLEASSFPRKLRYIAEKSHTTYQRVQEVIDKLKRYMVVKTFVSLATSLCVAGLLLATEMEFVTWLSFLAFLLNFIPTIGSIVAGVPAVLLALIDAGPWKAMIIVTGYGVINTVWGGFIEPRLMGRRLSLSPLVVLLSLIFWGWALGPVGMLLSAPLTMIAKLLFEENEDTRGLAILMGPADELPNDPEQSDGEDGEGQERSLGVSDSDSSVS